MISPNFTSTAKLSALYHIWNVPLLVRVSMAQSESRHQNTHFHHHQKTNWPKVYDPLLLILEDSYRKCMQQFRHNVYFRALEKQICLELVWGSRLFCSCSSCRTSLPLVRHFASPPSHLLSLRSSLESMEVCDRSESWCKVIYWSFHWLGIHKDLLSPNFSSKLKLNQRLLTKRAALLSIAGSRGDRLAPHVGFC